MLLYNKGGIHTYVLQPLRGIFISDHTFLSHSHTQVGWEWTDHYVITASTPDCNVYVWDVNTATIVHSLQVCTSVQLYTYIELRCTGSTAFTCVYTVPVVLAPVSSHFWPRYIRMCLTKPSWVRQIYYMLSLEKSLNLLKKNEYWTIVSPT